MILMYNQQLNYGSIYKDSIKPARGLQSRFRETPLGVKEDAY